MAKRKTDTDNPSDSVKYNAADVAEFVAALETDEEPVDSAPESIATKRGRKVAVQDETTAPSLRSRPTAAEGAASLSNVLGQTDADDMHHLTKSKKGFPWGVVIGIVAALAIVSVAGFFFFNRAKKFSNTNIQVQFVPVATAVSGGELKLVIEYQNLEPVDVLNAELTVQYPDGFTYVSSTPNAAKEFKNDFPIGTIRSGQSGKVTIIGTILGAVGETRDFSATLSYRPSNFNSDFQQKASTQVKISTSILGLKFTGPTQLAPGATGTWTIDYTNTSDHDLKEFQINTSYPDGFTIASTKPQAQETSNVWRFSGLKKGESGTITVTGRIDGNLGDSFSFKASAGLLSATKSVELQDEQTLLVILIKTGVTTTVAVNGSTEPLAIEPGEVLNYLVRVTNASDVEITSATITAKLEGAAVDMTKLANDSKAKVEGSTLTWTKDQLAALASLKPNQAVTVSFAIGTSSTLSVKTDADRDPKVTATINVTSPGLSSNTNQASQPSTVVVTKIATIMGVTAEARYYDSAGVAVGSGPLPPAVGKTTSYRLAWTVTNTTSDATSLVVSARLPNSVLWTGKNISRDAGEISFDPATRLVRWTLNTLPAGTGDRLPALSARFEVSITPTDEQVGTVPILIETTTATATDGFTGRSLTKPAATLTTDLPTDTKAAGQSTVVSS